MKENKVIFIIAILIVIATIVFAAVYVSKSKNKEQNKVNSEANIKVYRLYEKENNNCSSTRSNNFWSKCLPFIKRTSNQRNKQ